MLRRNPSPQSPEEHYDIPAPECEDTSDIAAVVIALLVIAAVGSSVAFSICRTKTNPDGSAAVAARFTRNDVKHLIKDGAQAPP